MTKPDSLLPTYIFVILIGVVVRLGIIYESSAHERVPLPDEFQYWQLANSLADGQGLRDELGLRVTRMPLYPTFLALFINMPNGVMLAVAIQTVLSAFVCGLSAALAYQVCHESHLRTSADITTRNARSVCLVSGLLVAVDPFLAYFCKLLLTESLFTMAFVLFILISWPLLRSSTVLIGRWCLAGLAFSLCVYLKPSVSLFLLPWSVYLIVKRKFDRASLVGTLGVWVILACMLALWAARNYSLVGKWCWLTLNGGISLYDGVHAHATGASDLGHIKQMDTVKNLDEGSRDDYFKQESWRFIRQDPARILRLAWIKFCRTWNPWPNADGYQQPAVKWLTGIWTLVILSLATVGLYRLRSQGSMTLALLMPVIYFTILHMLFVGSVRYRLPIMPLIEILAAIGIVTILVAFKKRLFPLTTKQDDPSTL